MIMIAIIVIVQQDETKEDIYVITCSKAYWNTMSKEIYLG
jgi:hypothetical protein